MSLIEMIIWRKTSVNRGLLLPISACMQTQLFVPPLTQAEICGAHVCNATYLQKSPPNLWGVEVHTQICHNTGIIQNFRTLEKPLLLKKVTRPDINSNS